jgi:hypothetical protein
MISDVLSDAVAAIRDDYLTDPAFAGVYVGVMRERIEALVDAMDALRQDLDAPSDLTASDESRDDGIRRVMMRLLSAGIGHSSDVHINALVNTLVYLLAHMAPSQAELTKEMEHVCAHLKDAASYHSHLRTTEH